MLGWRCERCGNSREQINRRSGIVPMKQMNNTEKNKKKERNSSPTSRIYSFDFDCLWKKRRIFAIGEDSPSSPGEPPDERRVRNSLDCLFISICLQLTVCIIEKTMVGKIVLSPSWPKQSHHLFFHKFICPIETSLYTHFSFSVSLFDLGLHVFFFFFPFFLTLCSRKKNPYRQTWW